MFCLHICYILVKEGQALGEYTLETNKHLAFRAFTMFYLNDRVSAVRVI